MLEQKIDADIANALKDDKEKLDALRAIKSAIQVEKRRGGAVRDLSDDEVITIIRKLIKQSEDVIPVYEKSGRSDLIAHEVDLLQVYSVYIPKEPSAEEIEDFVNGIIECVINSGNVPSIKTVMPLIMRDTTGFKQRVTNKRLVDEVTAQLSKL